MTQQYMHKREDILAHGYEFTGKVYPEMPLYLSLKLARELDVTIDSLQSFRIAHGVWEVYYTPTRKNGYVSHAILPA